MTTARRRISWEGYEKDELAFPASKPEHDSCIECGSEGQIWLGPRFLGPNFLFQGELPGQAAYFLCPSCLAISTIFYCESGQYWVLDCPGNRLPIAVDLDGVLADIITPFIEILVEIYGEDKRQAIREFINHEDLGPSLGLARRTINDYFKLIIREGSYGALIKPSEITELLDLDLSLIVTTSRPLELIPPSAEWLTQQGIEVPLIGSHSKAAYSYLKHCRLVIEDRYQPIFDLKRKFPELRFLLLDQPWNENRTLNLSGACVARVSNWEKLLSRLRQSIIGFEIVKGTIS